MPTLLAAGGFRKGIKVISQPFTLDHIGWSTNDVEKFEQFWCGALGFELAGTSTLDEVRAKTLFGINGTAEIRRYVRNGMTVEIHNFGADQVQASNSFARSGISHICLNVEDREGFLKALPEWVAVKKVQHTGGWWNIFIQDSEQIWVELRTSTRAAILDAAAINKLQEEERAGHEIRKLALDCLVQEIVEGK